MRITHNHILDAIIKEPKLTYSGFSDNASEIAAWRPGLIKCLNEVQACFDWVQCQEVAQRVTTHSHSSYMLKHAVEFALKRFGSDYYVSNGCFIAACIIAGVPYQRYPKSPNAAVAIRGHRRNRALHGARAEHAPSYAEFKPMKVAE